MPGFGGGGFGVDPFGEWPWSRQVLYDFLPAIYRDQDQYQDYALEKWTDSLRYSFDEIADRITDWEDLRKPLFVRTQYDEVAQVRLGKVQFTDTPIEQRGVDGLVDAQRSFSAPSARFRASDLGKQLTLSGSSIPVNNRTFKIAAVVNTTKVRCDPPLITDAGPLRWSLQGLASRPEGVLPIEVRGGSVDAVKPGWILFDGFSEFTIRSRQRFYPDSTQAKSLTLREGKEGIVLADGRFKLEVPLLQTDVGRPLTISGSTQTDNNGKFQIYFVDATDLSVVQLHRTLVLTGTNVNAGVSYTLQLGQSGVQVQHILQGPSSLLLVSVASNVVTVALATNGVGAPISTAAQVAAAVNASFLASELVSAGFTGTGAGLAALHNPTTVPGARLSQDAGPLVWALLPFPQILVEAAAPPQGVIEQEGVDLEFTSTPGTLRSSTAAFTANDIGKTVFARGSLLGQDGSYTVLSVNNVNELLVSFPGQVLETNITWELRTLTPIGDLTEVALNAPSMIQYLAQDFGIEIDTRESEARQRSWVENVTQWIDLKGTQKAYEILALISGFTVGIYPLYRISATLASTLPSFNVFLVGETGAGRQGYNGRLFSSGGRIRLTAATAIFEPADEGVSIRVRNCQNVANNKTYTIDSYIDPTTVEFELTDTAIVPDYGVGGTLAAPKIEWTVVRIYTTLAPLRPVFDEVNVELMQSIVGVNGFLVDTYCWDDDFVNSFDINITGVTPGASLGVPIFYTVTLTGILIPGPTYTNAGVVLAVGRWKLTDVAGNVFYVESVPIEVAPGPPPVHTLQVFSSVVPVLGIASLEYICSVQESCDFCKASALVALIEEGTILNEVGIAIEKVLERVIDRLINEVKPIHVQLVPIFRRTLSAGLTLTATITGAFEVYCVLVAALTEYYDILLGDVVTPDGPGLKATITTDPVPSAFEMSGLRLSLTTSVPVTSADVVGASTLYLTPYLSGGINLHVGGVWTAFSTAEVSLALAGLTSGMNYDVFAYWTGAVVALELSTAWATDVTRTTALVRQNGILVKSGDTTRLFVGTIRASSATTTEDSDLQRFVWNHFNRQPRKLRVTETTNTWAYVTAAYRETNGNTANAFEYVTGDAAVLLEADALSIAVGGGGAAPVASGVGIDSVTVSSAAIRAAGVDAGAPNGLPSSYVGYPGLGYHKITWLEYGAAAMVFAGDNGDPTTTQAGMTGEISG